MSATHRVESDSLLANQATMNTSSHVASATMGERIADQGTDGHDTHHRETHGNARLQSNRRGDEQCNHRSGEATDCPEQCVEGEVMQLKQEEDDAEHQPHNDQRPSPPNLILSPAITMYADRQCTRELGSDEV